MTGDDGGVGIRQDPDVDPLAVRALFAQSDWAARRSVEEIRGVACRVCRWSSPHGTATALWASHERSDDRSRALVEDVIVDAELRGRGIGRRLVDAVLGHPRIREVELVVLSTAIPDFYRRSGSIRTRTGCSGSAAVAERYASTG